MTGENGFLISGRELAAEPLHYRACGLDDVYLLNGFTRHDTEYGSGVAVECVDDLHRAIAEHIVAHRKSMSGGHFRFLRKQMDLTQNELAGLLGVDGQTVARYEKGETGISGPVDRLMRFVYVFSRLPQDERLASAEDVSRLLAADEPSYVEPLRFRATEQGWAEAA